MPSPRRRAAAARSQFTGEPHSAAARGVGRNGDLGLDHCTQAQTDLRALLALHVLNAGLIGEPFSTSHVHTITHYNLVVSPRYDELVLITDTPDAIVGYLRPRRDGAGGVAGLRLAEWWSHDTYRLVHLPSGGHLRITSRPDDSAGTPPQDNPATSSNRPFPRADEPITPPEARAVRLIPPIGPAARRLLAATLVRLNLSDPDRTWAVGVWTFDPLRRRTPASAVHDDIRQLYGAGNHWELRWAGYPFVDDIVRSLTHPIAGLAGAVGTTVGAGADITYDEATLSLRLWP